MKQPDGTAVHRDTGEPVMVGRVEAMSKSKRNTVDPGAIIARYGADTARWFILSDNPPERDMEWTEAGAAGAFRFTQRVFRLAEALGDGACRRCRPIVRPGGRACAARRIARIAAVTEALESFAFNVAVARLYELANAITDARARRRRSRPRLGAAGGGRDAGAPGRPMMPHLAEEVYAPPASRRGARWSPNCRGRRPIPHLLAAETRHHRGAGDGQAARHDRGAAGCAARRQSSPRPRPEPNVARALEGKRIVKEIYVPNRIVNFVVAG